jgi:hypothetical protein
MSAQCASACFAQRITQPFQTFRLGHPTPVATNATGMHVEVDEPRIGQAASVSITRSWTERGRRSSPAKRASSRILKAAAWKLSAERGPNEDKRRLRPDDDAPKELLEALADAGELHGRSVRLLRRAGERFEFVHDRMNAFLAASWLVGRPTVAEMRETLAASR